MPRTICIPERLSIEPGVAHPGLCAGLLASDLSGAVEVRLLRAIPVHHPLTIEPVSGSSAILTDGCRPLAAAARSTLAATLPRPPAFDLVAAAPRAEYAGSPGCYVCGIACTPGARLGLTPRRLAAHGLVASPFVAGAGIACASGGVRPEFAWAALSCLAHAALPGEAPRALDRIAAQVTRPLVAGRRYVAAAWHDSGHHATAAIWDDHGDPHAIAVTTWRKAAA